MASNERLTHIDPLGLAQMVDVSSKTPTKRVAVAECRVILTREIVDLFSGDDIYTPKGSVFQVATIAGILAAKKTGELIPMCHPVGLDNVTLDIKLEGLEVLVRCTAVVNARTGVEMEALTGASIAALTIYDMCKAMSHDIEIRQVRLVEKSGGKKDFRRNA